MIWAWWGSQGTHIPGGESVNPSGSSMWLKLDSAQTPLHRKASVNDSSWPLPCSYIIIYVQNRSSSIEVCFKPYQMPQNLTSNFHFALLFTSLFIALLHQVPTQVLSLFQVLILCFLLSTLSPCFPTHSLHSPAVTSALPQPLNRIFLSILSLLHYYKMSCISFPKRCFLRNYFALLQLKNQVFSSKSCNF